jgi:hypothetical protein
MPSSRKRKASAGPPKDQWVTLASCDVGERALACWIGCVNLRNPLQFKTLEWWVVDVYPEAYTGNARNTSAGTVVRFVHDLMRDGRFSARHIKHVQAVIVETQFRPNGRMQSISHAFMTNIWWLLPNAKTALVSSQNKMRFIKKHRPDFLPPDAELKAMSDGKRKLARKKASVDMATVLEPERLPSHPFRKHDDLADTLLQALGSVNSITKLLKPITEHAAAALPTTAVEDFSVAASPAALAGHDHGHDEPHGHGHGHGHGHDHGHDHDHDHDHGRQKRSRCDADDHDDHHCHPHLHHPHQAQPQPHPERPSSDDD